MTLRGFKEAASEYSTFAGTASRTSQRLLNSLSVLNEHFTLQSWDISSAFARGMTFEMLARTTGEPLREVCLEIDPADADLVRAQSGFETFDYQCEVLRLRKAIYGLRDAPRAWSLQLRKALLAAGLRTSLLDHSIYVMFLSDVPQRLQAQCKELVKDGPSSQLVAAISSHVDDLKCVGLAVILDLIASELEKSVGKLTKEAVSFTHTGVHHQLGPQGLYVHQFAYADQLQMMNLSHLKGRPTEEEVPTTDRAMYMSLLGALSWLVQTRADLAIFVQTLQRHGKTPRVVDMKRMNAVVAYAKRHRVGLWYPRLRGDLRVVAFSDAAFKAVPSESSGLAIKGLVLCLMQDADTREGFHGSCHILEALSLRQRRVTRSTFAAEVNSLVDGMERAYAVQMALCELVGNAGRIVQQGSLHQSSTPSSHQVRQFFEQGSLLPRVTAVLDARSVYDAITCPDFPCPFRRQLGVARSGSA